MKWSDEAHKEPSALSSQDHIVWRKLHRTRGDPVDTEKFGSDQKVIKYSWWKAAVAANTKLRCIRNDSRPAYLWTSTYITVKI